MFDVIHGYKTIFPIPLAMGCSFDTQMVEECAEMSAKEATGVDVPFSPMVDLVRDCRWGRVMESTGEDVYLNGEMGKATVSAVLTNTGSVYGEEVVQLYIRDTVSSFVRPVKQLKGYQKVALGAGESVTVTFEITRDTLGYYDDKGIFLLEKGEFELILGTSSDKLTTVKIEVV